MNAPTRVSNFRDALERHREYRRELETLVMPLASSLDGRRFSFQAPLRGLRLEVGGYVVLESESVTRLGQIVALREDRIDAGGIGISLDTRGRDQNIEANVSVRHAGGEGEVLDGDGRSFVDARVRPACPEEVGAWVERAPRKSAGLAVGTLALAQGVPFPIRADGFARHTFFCGQSGSGKTYSLGAILEQLLLETTLRIIVLDPNSDFVRLHETRPEVATEVLARYSSVAPGIRVRQVGAKDGNELYFRASDLSLAAQAAALRLDPIRDSDEYESLRSTFGAATPESLETLAASDAPGARELTLRLQNLGVDAWEIWALGRPGSLVDDLGPDGPRLLVVDLGSLGTLEEKALTSELVLSTLWNRRADRSPVLIVIDEAHNVCPGRPTDAITTLATEHAVRIAGEGRKFGLHLLVSTQRPQKIHENVLSQCDNLVLMRMNSLADLDYVRDTFSFVPPGLLERASRFDLCQALVAGNIVSHPTLLQFGKRIALEGRADVSTDWAKPRK
jgi:DNA helicase HerA-like ATPase